MADTGYVALDESSYDDRTKEWTHVRCGTVLLGAQVIHSVHDGPGLSGHGEVQTQTVPYCPTCHQKPNPYGAAIRPGDKEWPRVHLKPREASLSGSSEPSA